MLQELPTVTTISTTPSSVSFSQLVDGAKDTTLTVYIYSAVENVADDYPPLYKVTDLSDDSIIATDTMSVKMCNLYCANFEIDTQTQRTSSYLVEVFAFNENGEGNYATANLEVSGFPNQQPEIVAFSSPDTVFRPQSGSSVALFTAQVNDPDGNSTIDNAYVVITEQSASAGTTIVMSDDGVNRGDEVAGDFIYSVDFEIPANPSSEVIENDFFIYGNWAGMTAGACRVSLNIMLVSKQPSKIQCWTSNMIFIC